MKYPLKTYPFHTKQRRGGYFLSLSSPVAFIHSGVLISKESSVESFDQHRHHDLLALRGCVVNAVRHQKIFAACFVELFDQLAAAACS